MHRPAFSFVRDFEAAEARPLCVDRHYLLCVSRGAIRLEADGTVWSLPPARAALIRASHPILVTIAQPTTTASVLISPDLADDPATPLSVFDLTPLARLLIAECGQWGDVDEPLDAYAHTMFGALVATTWQLAQQPSPIRMPAGRTAELRAALALTEKRLADDPKMGELAAAVGLAERSLARRFEDELGMTWRAALRRMRILKAVELLGTTDRSVTEVAFEVGYSSLSAFQTAFRDLVGATPSSYRAAMQGPVTP